VARGEQGLHAASAAQVERGTHVAPDRQPCEQQGGRVQADHVIRAKPQRSGLGPVARQHQALGHHQSHERHDLAGARFHEPERLGFAELERREGRPRVSLARRQVQREEPDERVERRVGVEPPQVKREVDAPRLRAEGHAERRGRFGAHVASSFECRTKSGDGLRTLRVEHQRAACRNK